jgi:hypothetical protein
MTCNFKFICPQTWWIVDVGFSQVSDRKNATQTQKKCQHLDYQATNIFYQSMKDSIFGEIMDMKSAQEIWIYLNEKYGAIFDDDDDDHKEKVHECVKHDHNLVIVEDCSTSWSSDDDDQSTTSSLDKINDDASSDANDDATPCTLDGDNDGSCSDDIATTSPSTTPHCFMSEGDTKVSNANVVHHDDSYDELVSRLVSMTISLENEKAKMMKLEK